MSLKFWLKELTRISPEESIEFAEKLNPSDKAIFLKLFSPLRMQYTFTTPATRNGSVMILRNIKQKVRKGKWLLPLRHINGIQ